MARKIVVLSGGHGGARIAREIQRQSNSVAAIVVNAFDDGKSTGALRKYIPGMLGPSDIRKNASQLVSLSSPERDAIRSILEYRIRDEDEEMIRSCLDSFAQTEKPTDLPTDLRVAIDALSDDTRAEVAAAIRKLIAYSAKACEPIPLDDAAFGNLIFAGIFLDNSMNFNASVRAFLAITVPATEIINVTEQGGYVLRGISNNGMLLSREEEIVCPPDGSGVLEIYVHNDTTKVPEKFTEKSTEEIKKWLKKNATLPEISVAAREALQTMDALVIAPGTAFSSILPTLIVIQKELKSFPNRTPRFYIANLDEDQDSPGVDLFEHVQNVLIYMGDAANSNHSLTHVLADTTSSLRSNRDSEMTSTLGCQVAWHRLRSPASPDRHSAYKTAASILRELGQRDNVSDRIIILVETDSRNNSMAQIIEDFLDITWSDVTHDAQLLMIGSSSSTFMKDDCTAMVCFADWPEALDSLRSRIKEDTVVAVLRGDGFYVLADVIRCAHELHRQEFAVVAGSRVQDRKQRAASIKSTYDDRRAAGFLSLSGGLLISVLLRMRFGITLSDPLTGFHVYNGSTFTRLYLDNETVSAADPGSEVSYLVRGARMPVEIAELPIRYSVPFSPDGGRTRLMRGLRNLIDSARLK
jgi:2-phospho-L-lactate transferase/gluconeogenesis factor (CofD/UPF0052 family)